MIAEKLESHDIYKQQPLLRSLGVTLKSSRTEYAGEFPTTTVDFVLMNHPSIRFNFVISGREEFAEFLKYDRDKMIRWITSWSYIGGKCYYKAPKLIKPNTKQQ